MKKKIKFNLTYLCALTLLILTAACTEDEFQLPQSEPIISLPSATISGLPGETVTIGATITDPVGLSEVQIVYAGWGIDESIALTEVPAYELAYELAVPQTAEIGSTHELTIIATNVNGVKFEAIQAVILNVDNTLPVIVNNTTGGVTFLQDGNDVTLLLEITDNRNIATVKIIGPNISEEIIVGSSKYNYNRALNINREGIYNFEVTATDDGGNSVSETLTILAFNAFDNMYLADVDTDAELTSDLMGIPMLANGFTNVDSLGKVFEAYYYNAVANTEIRFIPSTETFSEVTFGAGNEAGTLAAAEDATVSPIVLTEVGYTKVLIDLRDLTYTTETYTPTDDTFSGVFFIGTGVRVDGQSTCVNNLDDSERCFHFQSGKPLTVDSSNPYRFTGTVELFDFDPASDANNAFILNANTAGWAPFWRFDPNDAQVAVPGGGSNFNFGESQFGTYNVTFDTHLNRIVAISNN